MKFIICLFLILITIKLNSKDYIIKDTATVEIIENIKLSDNSEYSIISIIGHWKDNLGSFGSSKCYGSLEKKHNITLVLDTVCEKESLNGKIITRGGRKNSINKRGRQTRSSPRPSPEQLAAPHPPRKPRAARRPVRQAMILFVRVRKFCVQ